MASRSLNRIILIGNLTRDPELKYTPNGTAVCNFGVATNRSWSTASGDIKEDVQFHRIVCWQKLAELASKLLSKGRKVYLEGRMVYRTYTGKDNIQKTTAEIIMDDFILFDDRHRMESSGEQKVSSDTKSTTTQKKSTQEEEDFSDDLSDFDIDEEDQSKDEENNNNDKSSDKEKKDNKKQEKKTASKEKEEVQEDDIPF